MFTLGQTSLPCSAVVEIFRLDNLDDPSGILELKSDVKFLKPCQIGAAFIDGNPLRSAVGTNVAFEEASRRC